ncbi:hypothetical protein P8452_09467 [Trifolium repens]|nr:hypothetical protein P8452_09467 [Trifolium repens]
MEEDHGKEKEMVTGDVIISKAIKKDAGSSKTSTEVQKPAGSNIKAEVETSKLKSRKRHAGAETASTASKRSRQTVEINTEDDEEEEAIPFERKRKQPAVSTSHEDTPNVGQHDSLADPEVRDTEDKSKEDTPQEHNQQSPQEVPNEDKTDADKVEPGNSNGGPKDGEGPNMGADGDSTKLRLVVQI